MNHTDEEKRRARIELYDKLAIAEQQSATGEKRIGHEAIMAELKTRLPDRKFSFDMDKQ